MLLNERRIFDALKEFLQIEKLLQSPSSLNNLGIIMEKTVCKS